MKRRDFARSVTLAGLIEPMLGRAQPDLDGRRIGALFVTVNDELGRARLAFFRRRLEELGWSSGRNVQIDVRWASGDYKTVQSHAADLARTKPDAILALGTAGVAALLKETRTIPIVFVQVTDPVAAGFVRSLSFPGGNVTGFANFGPSVGGERLRILKEVAPRVRRVMVIFERDSPLQPGLLHATKNEANALGIQITEEATRDVDELQRNVVDFARESNGGLVVVQGPFKRFTVSA